MIDESWSEGSNPSSSSVCYYGCNQEGHFYFKSTNRWCCSKSVNSCFAKRSRDSQGKLGKNPFEGREHPRGNLGKGGKLRDKPLSVEHRQKLSKANLGRPVSQETRQKISKSLQNNPNVGGYRTKSGTGKIHGSFYRDIWMASSWELAFAKRLDELNIKWVRDLSYFEYEFEGKTRKYYPDFYLPERDLWIEIKGFWTPKARAKISYVQGHYSISLLVLDDFEEICKFL